jgi:hypothetical protein
LLFVASTETVCWSSLLILTTLFTSRHQLISQGKQGTGLNKEKQLVVASHTDCTFTQDAEQIRDGVDIFFFSSSMPASSPSVPLQQLALLDGRHGFSDWFLEGLYVLLAAM